MHIKPDPNLKTIPPSTYKKLTTPDSEVIPNKFIIIIRMIHIRVYPLCNPKKI